MVICGGDPFVAIGFPSSDAAKRNHVFRKDHFRANEFVRAGSFHDPCVFHGLDALLIRRSANENYLALRLCCVVQRPAVRDDKHADSMAR